MHSSGLTHKERRPGRGQRGASIVVLAIALASVLGTVDIFCFNISRILVIQRQIDGICQAAALAGTCVLAKVDVSDDNAHHEKQLAAQQQAIDVAENMLLRGYILNEQIKRASLVKETGDLGKGLAGGCCQYQIRFLKTDSGDGVDKPENISGQAVRCSMVYGYQPVFMYTLLGNCYAIAGSGIGGIPQIDSVWPSICLVL